MKPKHSTIASMLATASGFALLSAVSTEAAAPASPAGYIKASIYQSTTGGLNFVNDAKYSNSPDGVWYPGRFEWYSVSNDDKPTNHPADFGGLPSEGGVNDGSAGNLENFGTLIAGYFYPPTTGDYQFAISCDDPGSLYLSTNDDPANKVLLASEPTWNDKRAFGTDDRRTKKDAGTPDERNENLSKKIALKAGQAYYIEAISKEGGGGDNLAVAYRLTSDTPFDNDYKPIPGSLLSPLTVPTGPQILAQPKNVALLAGKSANFSIGIAGLPPGVTLTSIQWKKNGANVPDSNSAKISVPVTIADNGAKIKAVVTTSFGTVESAEATLTVVNEGVLTKGFITMESYLGISGTPVQGLLDDPKWPNGVDETYYTSALDSRIAYPDNSHENYAGVFRGWIVPTETANYTFHVRSDDASQLYLSTNDKAPVPGTDAPIAEETGCCGSFEEVGAPETSAEINLKAGQRYALIYIFKEGGGGDFGQVAWRKVGDTTAAGQLKPISGLFLETVALPSGGVPAISKQPSSVSTAENEKATFTVAASATPGPLAIVWLRNGTPVASGDTYTTGLLKLSDNGAKIQARITTPGNTLLSDEVTVTVNADKTGPGLKKVNGSSDFSQVSVVFSEPVTAASAGNKANYSFDKGLTVSSVSVDGPDRVTLTTSKQPQGETYSLTVSGIQDTASPANASPAGESYKFSSWKVVPGAMTAELFLGVAGGIQGLKDWPAYQANTPDIKETVQLYEYPAGTPTVPPPGDVRNNYGTRVSGFFTPPTSGDWTFFLATDDPGELWLSTDENPANAVLIANEPTWNPVRAFRSADRRPGCPDACENRSAPVKLVAGKSYYTYSLAVEGGGGDNLAVTAVPSSQVTEEFPPNGYAPLNGAVVSGLADPCELDPASCGKAGGSGGGSITGVRISGANIVIDFTGTIQSSDSVTGPWTDVAGSGSVSVPASAGAAFYRIKP